MNLKVFLIFLFVLHRINNEKIKYEDITTLCSEKCECKWSKNNFFINCTDASVHYVLNNWPENKTKITGIFSKNDILRLEKFPSSKAEIELTFDHSNIKELGSGLFEDCINTKYVDLSHNYLTSEQLHSDVFKGPYNEEKFEPIGITHLNLGYNKIHSLKKNLFEHMPHLEVLNLEGNDFTVLDIQSALSIGSNVNLIQLYLGRNGLTEILMDLLVNLKNLQHLDISYNRFDFVPATLGYVGESLKVLNVSGNPIIELDDESFQGTKRLKIIYARDLKKLKRIKTNTFAHLNHLLKLDLENSFSLSEIDEEAFGNITGLRELNLRRSNLTTLPKIMVKWELIRKLDMSENPFICSCDLLNITNNLSNDVKTMDNSATCWDVRKPVLTSLYYISNDLCTLKWFHYNGNERESLFKNVFLMRILLVTLSIAFLVSVFLATWLLVFKWNKYKRNRRYPFANQVVYNPINAEIGTGF